MIALFNCVSALEAEALACVEGIRLASQWCQGLIILESDCDRVVQALTSKSLDRSEIGFVIAEGKELSQLVVELKIVKIKRDCNKLANELAALAWRNTHRCGYVRLQCVSLTLLPPIVSGTI